MFHGLKDWFHRRSVLRELRVGDKRYNEDNGKYFEEQIALAQAALDQDNREQALAIWHRMRALFPGMPMWSKPALRLLLDLGAFDEADALMQEGRTSYPHLEYFAKGYTWVAHRRGNPHETLRRCEIVRKKFPQIAEAYTFAAACLTTLGRHHEAEATIDRAVREIPHNFDVFVAYAQHAELRDDWPEALRRWELVNSRFDDAMGPRGIVHSLRQMGRYAEAEEIAIDTCERFPTNPWSYVTRAVVAADKGDLDAEIRCWADARKRCPFFALGYTSGADAARRTGQDGEADKILTLAVARLRSDLGVHLLYARSASDRGDGEEATRRWALVHERFPDCDEAREQAGRALAAAALKSRD